MKKVLLIFALLGLQVTLKAQENATEKIYSVQDLQKEIKLSFNNSFYQQNTDGLDKINQKIEGLKMEKPLSTYWKALVLYYKSIFYLKFGQEDQLKLYNQQAINLLSDLEGKTADDYALITLLKGISYFYSSKRNYSDIADEIDESITQALSLAPESIRALFAAGNNDFYTPEKFGGGKKVQEFLEKAIALQQEEDNTSFQPTWGREECYEVLLQHLYKKKDTEKLNIYLEQAKKLYPENYFVKDISAKLYQK